MVRVVVDTMMGNLARWLRVLGVDTEYSRRFTDSEILSVAFREGRVVITKDLGLHRRALKLGLRSVYIPPDTTDVVEMLVIVARELGLSIEFDKGSTRCPICNTKLSVVSKAQVSTIVPPEVLNRYDTFWYCPRCHKAYWQGNHWKTISDVIEKARSRLGRAGTY
jgi:uncharacterized protein with PIN domain